MAPPRRRKPRSAARDPWSLVLANEGLLVGYIADHLPWACRNEDLHDTVRQIGRLLVYRAVRTYDPKNASGTTLGGWILSVLKRQLKHRVREEQGLAGRPSTVLSLSLEDEDGEPVLDVEDRQPSVEDLRLGRAEAGRAMAVAVRSLVQLAAATLYGELARRAIVRAILTRAWGAVARRPSALERATRYGARVEDVLALERAWIAAVGTVRVKS